MSYEKKYLKYKLKYLNLKNQLDEYYGRGKNSKTAKDKAAAKAKHQKINNHFDKVAAKYFS